MTVHFDARDVFLAVVVDAAGFFHAMPCVEAPCHDKKGNEETDRGNGEDGDGSAESGADLWASAGSRVTAHTAALCAGDERGRQQQHQDADAQQMMVDEVVAAHMRPIGRRQAG